MVHSQLVIKIKLLRSEQGCLFSYLPVLLWINFRFTLFTTGTKGLVTNYGEGGATKREGAAREVLPL